MQRLLKKDAVLQIQKESILGKAQRKASESLLTHKCHMLLMIRTYIKLQFDSSGAKPSEVIRRLKEAGCSPIIGDFDFEKGLKQGESLFNALDEIHAALKGTGVKYSVTTRTLPDSEGEKKNGKATSGTEDVDSRILDAIEKRGSTAAALSKKLSVPKKEIEESLQRLLDGGSVSRKKRGRYYIYLKN